MPGQDNGEKSPAAHDPLLAELHRSQTHYWRGGIERLCPHMGKCPALEWFDPTAPKLLTCPCREEQGTLK